MARKTKEDLKVIAMFGKNWERASRRKKMRVIRNFVKEERLALNINQLRGPYSKPYTEVSCESLGEGRNLLASVLLYTEESEWHMHLDDGPILDGVYREVLSRIYAGHKTKNK